MSKYLYRIEVKLPGKDWQPLFGEQDESREYMRGRFSGFRDKPGPRFAYRLVQTSPTDPALSQVLDTAPERTEVSVGMVPQSFGHQWPMYAMAAARALKVAAGDIRHAAQNDPSLQGKDIMLKAWATEVEALVQSSEETSES